MSRRNLRPGTTVCILLCLLTALLAAGAQNSKEPAAAPPAPKAEDEQLRKVVGAPIDPNTYLIGSEDILNIRVWREPDLSGPVGVRPDGKISLPLLGDVQAGGETPEKLAASLTEAFSKFVTSPEVMVSVAAVNSKKYFISGEVARPGSYPLVVPTTVAEALAIAGGFRDYADKKNVMIMRGPKRYKFNYRDFERGRALPQNITLENGDHIIVPQ
jgi:polysaccharide export outer membrane protein